MKLNANDILIAYSAGTFTSIVTAGVGGYVWQNMGGHTDFDIIVPGMWLLTVGIPSTLVSMDLIKNKLGQKLGTSVTSISNRPNRSGRKIPFTANGQTSNVFMSAIQTLKFKPDDVDDDQHELPETFVIIVGSVSYTIMINELDDFLRVVWRRQRNGNNGLSRKYWLTDRRPDRMKRTQYDALMTLILTVDGLVLDRTQNRSGRIVFPPQMAIKMVQQTI